MHEVCYEIIYGTMTIRRVMEYSNKQIPAMNGHLSFLRTGKSILALSLSAERSLSDQYIQEAWQVD